MKKRKILSIPEKTPENQGKVLTAFVDGEILALDCWNNKDHLGRYCISQEGEYGALVEGSWKQIKLNRVFGYEYSYYVSRGAIVFDQKQDEKLAQAFLKCSEKGDVLYYLDSKESGYLRKKADNAWERRKKRIEDIMDKVPTLPEGFEDWCNKAILKDAEYMFKTEEEGIWYCTACGETHSLKEKLKHNQIKVCSRKGKATVIKKRQQEIRQAERCMVLQPIDDERIVARHFNIRKVWNKENEPVEIFEEIRYIMGRNVSLEAQGKKTHPLEIYYGQYSQADEFEQEWWDSNRGGKHCYVEYCFPGGVKEALKGTCYENLAISLMAEKEWKVQYNKIMAAYRESRCLEYFAKAGLEKLTMEISESFSPWNGCYYGDLIDVSGTTAAEVMRINLQRFHRLKQNNGGKRYLKWLQWEEAKGVKIPEETIRWLEKSLLDPDSIEFIRDRMSPMQVKNYIIRQQVSSGKSIKYILDIWKDYLSMAKRLNMDVQDEIVYRVKDLVLRHDELVEVLNKQSEDRLANEMKEKYPNVEIVLGEIRKKYEYKNNEYCLTAPQSISDIMRDGRMLHHCAGSSERYFERIDMRETFILFIRKTSRPLHPFYTLEVEPDGTVRQKRSEYNRQPELKEIMEFIKEWQQELKKRLKKEDKALAEKSRKRRKEEMERLMNGDQRDMQLAETLGNDLMEQRQVG